MKSSQVQSTRGGIRDLATAATRHHSSLSRRLQVTSIQLGTNQMQLGQATPGGLHTARLATFPTLDKSFRSGYAYEPPGSGWKDADTDPGRSWGLRKFESSREDKCIPKSTRKITLNFFRGSGTYSGRRKYIPAVVDVDNGQTRDFFEHVFETRLTVGNNTVEHGACALFWYFDILKKSPLDKCIPFPKSTRKITLNFFRGSGSFSGRRKYYFFPKWGRCLKIVLKKSKFVRKKRHFVPGYGGTWRINSTKGF